MLPSPARLPINNTPASGLSSVKQRASDHYLHASASTYAHAHAHAHASPYTPSTPSTNQISSRTALRHDGCPTASGHMTCTGTTLARTPYTHLHCTNTPAIQNAHTCSVPMRPTTGPTIPPSEQSVTVSRGGGVGNMQLVEHGGHAGQRKTDVRATRDAACTSCLVWRSGERGEGTLACCHSRLKDQSAAFRTAGESGAAAISTNYYISWGDTGSKGRPCS